MLLQASETRVSKTCSLVSIDSFCYPRLTVLCDFENDPAIRGATSPTGTLLILYVSCYEFIDFVQVCTTRSLIPCWCPAEVLQFVILCLLLFVAVFS